MTCQNQPFCLEVLTTPRLAFRETGGVLVAHNEQSGCLGHSGINTTTDGGRHIGGLTAGKGERAREHGDFAEEGTFCIAIAADRLGIRRIDRQLNSRETLIDGHLCLSECTEKNNAGRTSVLGCIVMLEIDAECLCQIAQPIPTLRVLSPRSTDDHGRIEPATIDAFQRVALFCLSECCSIEERMGDNRTGSYEFAELMMDIRQLWRASDLVLVYTVYADVH